MNKEYQYTYNEAHYRERLWLLYDLARKDSKSRAGNYLVFIILCAIFGTAFLYFDSDRSGVVIGPLLLIIGVIYLSAYINYRVKLKQSKAIFTKELETNIDRLNASDGLIKFAFSDEDFYYSDNDLDIRIKWDLMKSYLLFDIHLMLISNSKELTGYTLSAFDLSPSEFEEICEFVKTKLPAHYLTPKKGEKQEGNPEILDN